jgi:hypothetical protein
MSTTARPPAPKRSWWPYGHIALAVASGVALWVLLAAHPTHRTLIGFMAHRRGALYPTAVGLFGTLLGFALASLAVALGYAHSERLSVLRDSGWLRSLYGVFVGALRAFAVALVIAIGALLFDTDDRPNRLMTSLLAGAVVFALARLVRLLAVFEGFVKVVLSDHARPPGG